MHQGSDSADLYRMVELLDAPWGAAARGPGADPPRGLAGPARAPGHMIQWQDAVRRAMGTLAAWEGPAAVVATDGEHLSVSSTAWGGGPCAAWSPAIVGSFSPARSAPSPWPGLSRSPASSTPGRRSPWTSRPADPPPWRCHRGDLRQHRPNLRELHRGASIRWCAPRLPPGEPTHPPPAPRPRRPAAALFGWDTGRKGVSSSMARQGKEPISAMGYDRPLAAFQPRPAAARQVLPPDHRRGHQSTHRPHP